MEELQNKIKKEFIIEKIENINNNIDYIEKYKPKRKFTHVKTDKLSKGVIPMTTPQKRYYFYNHYNSIVHTDEDKGLGYIPFVFGQNKIMDIPTIDECAFRRPTISFDHEIRFRMIKTVLLKYPDKLLHSLVQNNTLDKDSSHFKDSDEISKLAKFYNISLKDIINKWEEIFDKNPHQILEKEPHLDSFFCVVCLIFDCSIHNNKIKTTLRKKSNYIISIKK